MLDVDSILSRCATQPVEHLGQKSLHLFCSYIVGYELCCQSHNQPRPFDKLGDWSAFRNWTEQKICMTREHESRLNAWSFVSPYTYARFISADDSIALDTFINMRSQAIHEFSEADIEISRKDSEFQPSPDSILWSNGQTAFHKLDHLKSRPGLYFGNDWSLLDLWAYFSGYQWCERDHGVEDSQTQRTLIGFQKWLEQRYPFGRDIPWSRILTFLSLANRERALDSFLEHLEMYQQGLPSDAADPTMQEIISNIVNLKTKNKD